MRVGECDELFQRLGQYDRVGIEQERVATAADRERLIVRARETRIAVVADEFDVWIVAAHHLGGIVARSIVHDDDLEFKVADVGINRMEALA